MAKLCTFESCDRPLFCNGLCTAHEAQRRRGSELFPVGQKPKKIKAACSFPGCVQKEIARGLCPGHRMQKLAGHELAPLRTARSRTPEPHPEIEGEMLVPLTHGKFAVIDAGDAEAVSKYVWRSQDCDGRFYAVTTTTDGDGAHTLSLHRMLWAHWKLPATPEIDHRNTDGLDNRRENLRAATHAQNMWNQRRRGSNTSGHKGVNWDERTQSWAARYQKDGRTFFLGRFDDVDVAAAVRRAAVEQQHGEFVRHE